MAKYSNSAMADLAGELAAGLVRLRKGYIDAAEELQTLVEAGKDYPHEFVVYRLTGFRPTESDAAKSIKGKALIHDLLQLMLDVSESFSLRTSEYDEPVYDTESAAERFNVSTKTIQRWRRRGLAARKLVFPDGKRRIGFLDSTLKRFAHSHPKLIRRSGSFTQLSDQEREEILHRARRMAGFTKCTLSEVAKRISRRTGRAVETVRYTIRNHDQDHPGEAIFPSISPPLGDQEKAVLYRKFLDGLSVPTLARRFGRTRGSIYRVINEMRARQLAHRPIDYVYNPQFDLPNADAMIVGDDTIGQYVPEGSDPLDHTQIPRSASSLPPYLRSLYDVPLLSADEERDLFRKYNYLKHKADKLRRSIDPNNARTADLREVETYLLQANFVKNRIIRSNLRLVVSIAKKHIGGPQSLFELVSDGNVALMRAVEKFDYAKGYRFSTYASWAIMRNFARSVPKERALLDRFSTGHEEVLDIAASMKTYDPNEMNIPELRESIEQMLDHLSSRERTILIDHYGLDAEGGAKTFDELGKRLGISKERVRQIELQALKKLRRIVHPEESDLLS